MIDGKELKYIKSFGIILNKHLTLPTIEEVERPLEALTELKRYNIVQNGGQYIVFNIRLDRLVRRVRKYATNFTYCYVNKEDTLVAEYWKIGDAAQPYSQMKNDYKLCSTEIFNDASIKSALCRTNKCIGVNVESLVEQYNNFPTNELLDWAINRVGRLACTIRSKIKCDKL